MKNLKIGDVVSNGDERMVLEVLTNTALLSRYDDPTEVGGWYTLDELKDYTLVQPEKTLEEKFREVKDGDSYYMTQKTAEHLAQIAAEHYKDKR